MEHNREYRIEGSPYSVDRGKIAYKGWGISHSEWHPCHMGVDIGQAESMVMAPNGDYELIQHGLWNFDRVTRLICLAIDKGWSVKRISDTLHKLGERNR